MGGIQRHVGTWLLGGISHQTLSFCMTDPRVVVMRVPPEEVRGLGCKVITWQGPLCVFKTPSWWGRGKITMANANSRLT